MGAFASNFRAFACVVFLQVMNTALTRQICSTVHGRSDPFQPDVDPIIHAYWTIAIKIEVLMGRRFGLKRLGQMGPKILRSRGYI